MVSVGGFARKATIVSYEHHYGPVPPGNHILHKCDNRECCNPAHLYAGTPFQNVRDRVDRGRSRHYWGEDHGRSVLSESDVTSIIERLSRGERVRPLANEYGVTKNTISGIRTGKTWTHLLRPARLPKNGKMLTESEVFDIRERIASGETQQSIAKAFGVSRTTISEVKRGRTWTSLGLPPDLSTPNIGPDVIEDMRCRRAKGETLMSIAKHHGVGYSTVWRHTKK